MKYITKDENIVKEYELKFDEEKIKQLMALIDRNCYVLKHNRKIVFAKSIDEAIELIKNQTNFAGEKVNLDFGIISTKDSQEDGLSEVLYDAIYKDSVNLIHMLKYVIENKDSDNPFIINLCKSYLDDIYNYEDNIDLKPFNKRLDDACAKISAAVKDDNKGLVFAVDEYGKAVETIALNHDYNFDLLYYYYREILKCIDKELVTETINYKTK